MTPIKSDSWQILTIVVLGLIVFSFTSVFPSSLSGRVSNLAAASNAPDNYRAVKLDFSDDEQELIELGQQLKIGVNNKFPARVITDLAQKRRELLNEKVDQFSPEALLLSVVDHPEAEQKEDVSGQLSITIVDDFESGYNAGRQILKLKGSNQEPLELLTVAPLAVEAGSTVRVKGYRFGDRLLIDPADQPEITAAPQAPEATGPQKTLAILVTFADSGPVPFSAAEAQNIFFGGQFVKFFSEQSYGRISFDGSVIGWLTLPRNGNCEWPTFGDGGELDEVVLEAAPNLDQYDRIVILSHFGCTAAGFSTIGKEHFKLGGNDYFFSVAQIGRAASYNQPSVWGAQPFTWTNIDYLLSHEVGHSLGLYHANGFDCHEAIFYDENCEYVEYGNFYDVMGVENATLHFNGFYKERLGWLTPAEVLTITQSGTYKLTNLESSIGQRAAKIKVVGHERYPFYVEARRPEGFNRGLGAPAFSSNQAGLFVYRIMNSTGLYSRLPNDILAYLLDLSPTTASWDQDIAAVTLDNGGLADRGEGVKLGPARQTAKNQTVFAVNLGNPSCVRQKPSLDSVTVVQAMPAGGLGSLRFSVRNRDSFLCGNSDFSLNLILPEGWSSVGPNPQTVSLSSDKLAFQSVDFTVEPNTPTGNYTIFVRATNSASGLTSTLEIPLTIYQAPQIQAIDPNQGKVGSSVIISGTGIPSSGAYAVFSNDRFFGGVLAQATGENTLSVVVPEFVIDSECECEVPTPPDLYLVKFSASGIWSNEVEFTITGD